MIHGIFGRPFVDLERYVDRGALESIDEEISLGLAEVPVDYTGGSHRSMEIMPASRAAARVGGGTFLGWSVLIVCSSSALLGTPFQPCSILGCATFAFTARGFAVGGAFASFWGAAIRSLFPCTLVSVPDLTAVVKLVDACRSIANR